MWETMQDVSLNVGTMGDTSLNVGNSVRCQLESGKHKGEWKMINSLLNSEMKK